MSECQSGRGGIYISVVFVFHSDDGLCENEQLPANWKF